MVCEKENRKQGCIDAVFILALDRIHWGPGISGFVILPLSQICPQGDLVNCHFWHVGMPFFTYVYVIQMYCKLTCNVKM